MNREIKFRVLDKRLNCIFPIIKLNKAIEGECEMDSCYYMNERNELEWLPFAEGILMQYTGLKDKNGVEIYEGDIYHMGDKNIRYVVVYEDAGFKGKQLGTSSYAGLTYWRENIEIIGNIYKNPELLGGGQWK